MIYLIDDKKLRQANYSWTAEKLKQFDSQLVTIYTKEELDKIKAAIFHPQNVILFHDSFFDNPINKHEKDVELIRQQLIRESKKMPIVFFGGATGSITIENCYASLPVSIVYANLEYFIRKYNQNSENINLKYLAFGPNYVSEEIENSKSLIWKLLYPLKNEERLEIKLALEEEIIKFLSIINKEDKIDKIIEECRTPDYLKFYLSQLINTRKENDQPNTERTRFTHKGE